MDKTLLKQMYPTEKANETKSPTGMQAEFDNRFCDVNTATKGTVATINQDNKSAVTIWHSCIPNISNGLTTMHIYLSSAIMNVNIDDISVDTMEAAAANLHVIEDFQNRVTYI